MNSYPSTENFQRPYQNVYKSSQINPNSSSTNLSNLNTGKFHEPKPNKRILLAGNNQFTSFQLPITPPISNASTPVKEKGSFPLPKFKSEGIKWHSKWLPPIDCKVVVLCLSWYFFSIISNNSTKLILSDFKHPITLTQMQFLLNSFFCLTLLSLVINSNKLQGYFPAGCIPNINKVDTIGKFLSPSNLVVSTTLPMGMFQFIGHITSHKATSLVPVSMVHTIKALSPITTVLIYRFIFKTKYKLITYVTLIPLILGIMITCYKPKHNNQPFYLTGLSYAFISMLIFVFQNIFAKNTLTSKDNSKNLPIANQKKEGKLDKLTILFYCSVIGFTFTLPIYIISEFNNDNFSLNSLTGKITLLVLINGFSHFLQSLLAFQILGLISPINYSIANIMKRIIIILISFIWENKNFSKNQTFGLVLTIAGLYTYDRWGTSK